jgi:hypothetical protein
MVSNWFIVAPKIRRIWSGEKVVMSSVLRTMNGTNPKSPSDVGTIGKYGASASPPNTTQASNAVVNAEDKSTEQNIVLRENENIPAPVEIDLYHLSQVINSLTKKR